MDKKSEVPVLMASSVWLLCFIVSFIMFAITTPTGDSFVRGLNRFMILLGWQFVAFLAAVTGGILTFSRRQHISQGLKWIGYTPLMVSGLCAAGVVVLVMFMQFR